MDGETMIGMCPQCYEEEELVPDPIEPCGSICQECLDDFEGDMVAIGTDL
jgi:hypothetical protein